MKSILVPINFSKSSGNTLRYAIELAKYLEMNLVLIHIYPFENYNRPFEFEDMAYDKGITKKMKLLFKENGCQITPNTRFLARSGAVAEKLIFVSERYDLMVLSGNLTSSSFERFFGKRSSTIVSNAKCPVLLVPPNTQFYGWNRIWHVLRYKDELSLMEHFLKNLKIDNTIIQSKSFNQKSFTSTFWRLMMANWNKEQADEGFERQIQTAKNNEHIDLILLMSHYKDTFSNFLNDAAEHSFFRFGIPVMVFQKGNMQ